MTDTPWQELLDSSVQQEPESWSCNVVHGGNGLSAQPFQVPGMRGQLLSVPYQRAAGGGDVHYITVCNLGTYSKFLIIDVSGHGEGASKIASQLHDVLWKLLDEGDNQKALAELNKAMVDLKLLGKFATVLMATYNCWFRSWTFTYAGHHSMLLCRNGSWQPLILDAANKSVPIGIVGDAKFEQQTIWLDTDDRLLLFSDSVIEVRKPDGELLGEQGVIEWLNGNPQGDASQQFAGLMKHLVQVNGSSHFNDDFTAMMLHHTPKAWTWWARQLCRLPPFDKWCWKF